MNAPVTLPEARALAFNPPPDQPWAWWRAALKGDFGTFLPLSPQQGYYRYRPRKRDRGEPCAIWFQDGQWIAEVNGQETDDIELAWRCSHQQPISIELFKAVRAGGTWPDELEVPSTPLADEPAGLGHNSRLPEEEVRDEIESADAAFAAWLQGIGGKVTNEEQDAKADAYAKRFGDFKKRIEEAHKAAKAPLLEQTRAIDAAWISGDGSVKAYAEACKKRVGDIALPYRIERKRKADEAAAQAREVAEAERQRRRIAEQKAAEAGRTYVPEAAPAKPMGTFTPKKATGLTERKVAVITDLSAVVAHLAAMDPPLPDLVEIARKIAERMLRAGVTVPGATLETEMKAR